MKKSFVIGALLFGLVSVHVYSGGLTDVYTPKNMSVSAAVGCIPPIISFFFSPSICASAVTVCCVPPLTMIAGPIVKSLFENIQRVQEEESLKAELSQIRNEFLDPARVQKNEGSSDERMSLMNKAKSSHKSYGSFEKFHRYKKQRHWE